MPQEFQVLRCFTCEKFQVHQTKKANKWQCKVCGEKQSLKKAYFFGSSKDCRTHVQRLNFEDGMRKVDCMLEKNFEDTVESENYPIDESENQNYEEALENVDEENLENCMPKKKYRYAEYETSYLDVSAHGFDDKILEVKQQTNPKILISSSRFDVSFEDPSVNNAKEQNNCKLSVSSYKENKSKTNAEKPKNRGFQVILNAAKKSKC